MAKKSTPIALYELIRPSPRDAAGAPEPMEVPNDARGGPASTGGGRLMRVPIGYVFLAIAVGIVALVGSFILGYKRGEVYGWADATERHQQAAAARAAVPIDPMGDIANNSLGFAAPGEIISTDPDGDIPGGGDGAWGDIAEDPRRSGATYFILAETHSTGARELAKFCRANGLEAYMVRANDVRRWVIVLPGFEGSQRSSPTVKSLEDDIRRVGARWKLERGGSDLHDYYPRTYNP